MKPKTIKKLIEKTYNRAQPIMSYIKVFTADNGLINT